MAAGEHRVWMTYTRPTVRRIDSLIEGSRTPGAFVSDLATRFNSPLAIQLIEAFRVRSFMRHFVD